MIKIPDDWILPGGHDYIRRYPWANLSSTVTPVTASQRGSISSGCVTQQDIFYNNSDGDGGGYQGEADGPDDFDLSLDEMLAFSIMVSCCEFTI